MSNRCRSLALFLTHPLFLSFISSEFSSLSFSLLLSSVCLNVLPFLFSPALLPTLSLSTPHVSLWPPTAVRCKVLANTPWSGGALVLSRC